jgi:hypothetical protein
MIRQTGGTFWSIRTIRSAEAEDGGVSKSEMARLQKYLRDKFGTERIVLGPKARKDGSVEVSLGGEFIGIIYRDEEDGEVSYAFHMAIMEMDLPTLAGL